MSSISRRGVLLGAAGGLLSGCSAERADRTGRVSGQVVDGSFESRWMRTTTEWSIAYPVGHGPGDGLPVLVSLHGRSGDHRTSFSSLRLKTSLDQVVTAGTAPFAIASVDGGDHRYWHRRTDGTDASAMVRHEFLPLLAKRGLDTDRLGLFGWSMGGYGALLIAGKQRLPVKAVAVSSPALFTSPGATAPGAFDSPEDFEANNVYGHPEWLRGLPLRVACGTEDPFYAATKTLDARVSPHPAGDFTPGGHNRAYWRRVAPGQLKFVGRLLTPG